MKPWALAVLAIAIILSAAAPGAADVIELSGGRQITGEVQSRQGGLVHILTADGQVIGVAEDDVVSITPTESIQTQFERMVQELPPDDADAWYDAALWCKAHSCPDGATEMGERAIAIDPDHAWARALLGYVRHEGQWMRLAEKMQARGFVRHEGRWVSPQAAENLEKGLVLFRGQWLPPDEAQMRKGLVRYLGRWMTPKAARRRHAARLTEWDRSKLLKAVEYSGGVSSEAMPAAHTAHYVVRTVDSVETAEFVAEFMEALHDKLDKSFRFPKVPVGRLKIYVFNNKRQFAQFAMALNAPLNSEAIGFFDPMSQVVATYFAGLPSHDVLQVLAHEGTHQFIQMVEGLPPPLWLDEGLAEYFGAVEWDGKEIRTGLVNHDRLAELFATVATGAHIPLGMLMHSENRLQFDSLHYAEAWSIVYFFFNYQQGKNIPLLGRFFIAVKSGQDQDTAFREIMQMPLAVFEKLWLEYVMSLAAAEFRPGESAFAGSDAHRPAASQSP